MLPPEYLCGVELFNAGEYFACHEKWEELWLASQGLEREYLQALIQAAVALHHGVNGNLRGALSLSARACKRLANLPSPLMGLDLRAFAADLEASVKGLQSGRDLISRPRIELASCH